MVKVALVRIEKYLGGRSYHSADENLGLGYLTSSLRSKNIETKIFDNNLYDYDNKKLMEDLLVYEPDFIGYTTNYLNIESVISFNENLHSSAYIVFGGSQATFSAEELINVEGVDAVIIGEGEESFPKLVLSMDKEKDLSDVKGIIYKDKNGFVYFTGYRSAIEDLNVLPDPARDVLEGYIKKDINEKKARVISSRGCFYNCKFCVTPAMRKINPGKVYRERNAKRVVDEIERLYENYGIRFIYFNDDIYFTKNEKTRERPIKIAEELIKRNLLIKYQVEIRADSLNPEDEKFIKLLYHSGLRRMFIGIESGSDKMLKYLNKGTNKKINKQTVEFLKSMGIDVKIGRILFGPFTNWTELKKTITYFYNLGVCDQILRKPYTKLEAFPGTQLIEELEQENLIENKSSYLHRNYKFKNPKIEEFYKVLNNSFPKYFELLEYYFKSFEKSDSVSEKLNKICFDFLIKNIKEKNTWTKNKFNKYLTDFIKKLRELKIEKTGIKI